MKKTIAILGSTGSIGITTLSIIDKKKGEFKVKLLAANKSINLINKQIKKYNPEFFYIQDKNVYKKIKKNNKSNKTKIINNFNLISFRKEIDITISAIPGIVGLHPTIEIIKHCKKVLIANKESVICGWRLLKKMSSKYKTKLIPVDSEHYSISKLIENHNLKEIKKVYITASGGPFLKFDKVFTGHYHMKSRQDNIVYLGNPYQLYWNDYGCRSFSIICMDTFCRISLFLRKCYC